MQAEVDSLRDNGSYAEATQAELKKLHHRDILPMKLVTGVQRDVNASASKFKVRAVVCGNFQHKQENEDLYTANADITSVRAALAAAAERRYSAKVLDVNTALLNANLPDSFEAIYTRPPQALVEFGLVAPGTVWRCVKAIYGLRISPKAWGMERDKELKKMTITMQHKKYVFKQSDIDPSVWVSMRAECLRAGAEQRSHDVLAVRPARGEDVQHRGAGGVPRRHVRPRREQLLHLRPSEPRPRETTSSAFPRPSTLCAVPCGFGIDPSFPLLHGTRAP